MADSLAQVVQKLAALEKKASDSLNLTSKLGELEKKVSQNALLNATHVSAASQDVAKLHAFVTSQVKHLDARDDKIERDIADLRAAIKALTAQVIKLGQK